MKVGHSYLKCYFSCNTYKLRENKELLTKTKPCEKNGRQKTKYVTNMKSSPVK